MALPPPGPERDRQLAAQPRYRRRTAASVDDVVGQFMKSEDVKRMRRFQRVAGALRSALDARALFKIKPVAFKGGVLTLEVAEGPLLSELRQHHAHALLAALVAAGTGVSRIDWRLARTQRGRAGIGKKLME